MNHFRKGDRVVYHTGSSYVKAVVRTAHRDGSFTVEAQFYLDKTLREVPGYLGYKGRYWPGQLSFDPLPIEATA